MRFTLYRSNCLEVPENCTYPHKVEVTGKDSLIDAVKHDYVCAEYQGNYRSNDNFIGSDCLPVDCDNDHSDDPDEWVYPSDVATAFPGVAFAVHYSRNHMKAKGGKAARPKFHVFFAIDRVTESGQYSEMKKLVNTIFPYFDTKALDAARFFFGTKEPEVEIFDGPMMLTTFLADDDFDANMDSGSYGDIVIPEGSRNATLSHYAGRILKRFGNTDEAHKHFAEVAVSRLWSSRSSTASGAAHSGSMGRSLHRKDTFLRSNTIRTFSSSPPTIPTLDRLRCWHGNMKANSAIHPRPIFWSTTVGFGRNPSPRLRP